MPFVRRPAAALTAVLTAVLVFALTGATAGTDPRGGELDGFTIEHLPEQIDDKTSVSDFEYEWGDVTFRSRVWEEALDGGGARVVLQVLVMRGDRITDLESLRDFLAEYHERSPESWELTGFDNGGVPGLHGGTEAFWSPAAGVGVEVRDAFGALGEEGLLATARSVRHANPA